MKNIKNMYKLSIFYLIIGLLSGLLYHEIAYYSNFTGTSVLKHFHPHAIILGALMFLILPIFVKVFSIDENKYFKKFMILYNFGLIMSLTFMGARGFSQLLMIPISNFLDHMIGGLAGIGHVILSIGFFFLYKTLFASIKEK